MRLCGDPHNTRKESVVADPAAGRSVWTLRRVACRVWAVWQDEGLASLFFRVLGETVHRRVVVMELVLNGADASVQARLAASIGLMTVDDIPEHCAFRPGLPAGEIRRRLEQGQWCFIARVGGRIVHAGWAVARSAWIAYLSRCIELAPGDVYVYESYTLPEFRGQNLAPAQRAFAARYLREHGFVRMIAVVMPENASAFRPLEKVGFRRIGILGYVKLGRLRRDFLRQQCGDPVDASSAQACTSGYWNRIAARFSAGSHYLDPVLADLKRRAHLALVERWNGLPCTGPVLKTDLFEEAQGTDALLPELGLGRVQVVGMDISTDVCRQALTHARTARADYVAADARHLPFVDRTFRLIVSPSTLDHFGDPDDLGRSLRELRRVLLRQGAAIVTLDNRSNVFDPLLRLANWLGLTPYFIGRSYTVGELREELESAGFVVGDATAILHNPRLMATASVAVANALNWRLLMKVVHRALTLAQRLESTRLRYWTGSFVAAYALRRDGPTVRAQEGSWGDPPGWAPRFCRR